MLTIVHFIFSFAALTFAANTRIINGKPAEMVKFKEVVKINVPGGACTATLVGPKVIMTAAHCAPNGATVKFILEGQEYSAKLTRSSLFPSKDHNVALGLLDKAVPSSVEPATIGGKASTGLGITLLGYGCTSTGGTGGNDGILRYGETVIRELLTYQVKSKADQGAVLCFGDSGGPAYVFESGKKLLIGVNSHGNQTDENSNTRTDITESVSLFQKFTSDNGVEICGVNGKVCGTVVPVEPKCNISVSPQTITLGATVTAKMNGTGDISEASIDEIPVAFPIGERTWKPSLAGIFTAKGRVKGSGGVGTCQASFTVNDPVQPNAPTCTLAASPSQIKLGEFLTLTLTVSGNATSASIQGSNVSPSGGSVTLTPSFAGTQSASASVSGPGGTNGCSTGYFVEGPQPNVPNFTVIPTYCGDNTVVESGVNSVCLGMVKYSWNYKGIALRDVVAITHSDDTKEVLPIVFTKEDDPKPGNNMLKVELGLYANGFLTTIQGLQLDIRKAILIKENKEGTFVPTSISGRTALQGKYFNVEQLKKVDGNKR